MAIAISRAEYDQLWQESSPAADLAPKLDDFETVQHLSGQIGRGSIKSVELYGMTLCLYNYQVHEDLVVQEAPDFCDGDLALELGFNLSGNRSRKRSGESFLLWGTDEADESWKTEAKAPIVKVDIHIDTAGDMHQFIVEAIEELPLITQKLLKKDGRACLQEINCINPPMNMVLEQIWHCPFQGKIRQIYLESKCLELFALKLEQMREREEFTPKANLLKPDDIDRIHLAKVILTANFHNPPSLMELARRVSLNDYKLKQGFRQVFGTTVFGYLHQYRMEKARQLLTEQRLNVREVAQAVGYANQSRFAAAFRKQYGVNPKSFALNRNT